MKQLKKIPMFFIPLFAGLTRSVYMYIWLIKPQNFFKTMGFIFGETFILVAIPMYIILILNKRLRNVRQTEEEQSSSDKKDKRWGKWMETG